MIRDYAAQQQYSFLGSVTVSMQPAPDRPQGTVEIVSEARVDHDVAPAAGPAAGPPLRPRAPRARISSTVRSPASAGESMRHPDRGPGVSAPPREEIRVGNDVVLRDLGSTNGTYVNGTPSPNNRCATARS